MFTGSIQEIGECVGHEADRISIHAPKACQSLQPGSSVALAGVCVTVEAVESAHFTAALSAETRRRSTLEELGVGARLNLERPLGAGDPLEGHLVQGHVDAVGRVTRIDEERIGRRLWIKPPERVLAELVAKGSIGVDGVSLTVAEIVRDRFSVALIPSTLDATTLAQLEVGSRVNLEVDLVTRLAQRHGRQTEQALRRALGNLPWAGVVHGRLGVEKVVRHFASGAPVLVWDPEREQEGDVIFSGAELRPEHFTFILTQACCHPTVPCDADRLERLEIPPMPGAGDHQGTAMHVSIDLSACAGTGVSAAERAATVRRLAHPEALPEDFVRPGHVFPLAARRGGLRERAGHTEVTVALCEAAGLPTVGVCCEIMSRDGSMAGPSELERFALEWGLPLIDVRELVERL